MKVSELKMNMSEKRNEHKRGTALSFFWLESCATGMNERKDKKKILDFHNRRHNRRRSWSNEERHSRNSNKPLRNELPNEIAYCRHRYHHHHHRYCCCSLALFWMVRARACAQQFQLEQHIGHNKRNAIAVFVVRYLIYASHTHYFKCRSIHNLYW